jgi:hypothetical protein
VKLLLGAVGFPPGFDEGGDVARSLGVRFSSGAKDAVKREGHVDLATGLGRLFASQQMKEVDSFH